MSIYCMVKSFLIWMLFHSYLPLLIIGHKSSVWGSTNWRQFKINERKIWGERRTRRICIEDCRPWWWDNSRFVQKMVSMIEFQLLWLVSFLGWTISIRVLEFIYSVCSLTVDCDILDGLYGWCLGFPFKNCHSWAWMH